MLTALVVAVVHAAAVHGIEALPVEVEVDVGRGIPYVAIVGLAAGAVKEGRVRVRAALDQLGVKIRDRRITVNLAPADLRKEGAAFELPIATGILTCVDEACAAGAHRLQKTILLGELALDGTIRPIRGALPTAVFARKAGFEQLLLPERSAGEALVVEGLRVLVARTLSDVRAYLCGAELPLAAPRPSGARAPAASVDFSDIRGQAAAKRALEVGAAGSHNVLLVGPPGSGKTMLAQRLSTVLPEISPAESLETSSIYSVAGRLDGSTLIEERPFRAPHHSISEAGLVGGGSPPRPGEISLAHGGVLFLDELLEFRRSILETLRQPLEDQQVVITRARGTVCYPARFMLVVAMNPCPCGHLGNPHRTCVCSPTAVQAYRSRLSGPLLDRIDLHIEVSALHYDDLLQPRESEPSSAIRARVDAARARQRERLGPHGLFCNAQMGPRLVKRDCEVDAEGHSLLRRVVDKLGMSARSVHRILKVARTIADLAGCERLATPHLAEAVHYRALDRPQ